MIKPFLVNIIRYVPGWHTKRRIVVIESDDWGSIRMPSTEVYNSLLKKGIPVNESRYNCYDNLADTDDLSSLFEVLTSVKDKNGQSAKITPLSIMANPDFEKIRASGFNEYHYEIFTETLKRYGGKHEGAFKLWKEGISSGIFAPQFHGREHLNVFIWLKALRAGSYETRLAFDNNMFGLNTDSYLARKNLYMSAFEFESVEEFSGMPDIIKDGARIFEQLFKYKANAFMAPCAIWSQSLEPALKSAGIHFIQTGPLQYEPIPDNKTNNYKKSPRFTGQRSSNGLVFSSRNCSFEPSEFGNIDWVNYTLSGISKAFKWNKPAIISSHRVNFIGNLVPGNRDKGLRELKLLLNAILKNWPETEFMTSAEFGNVLFEDK